MARRKAASERLRCIELPDSSTRSVPAEFLVRGAGTRDPAGQQARLSTQFVERNQSAFAVLGTSVQPRYDGTSVSLQFSTTTNIGAAPLRSPTSGQFDYGLVVRPRFDWPGIGPMLADMGWRVIPAPLRMPLLPRSERKVPPWVISTVVLARVEAMLAQLVRRFDLVSEERRAPRGRVHWSRYGTRELARARFLQVPCTFPDLRDDRLLRGALRFTLERQHDSLLGQVGMGSFVARLLERCDSMLSGFSDVAPRAPSPLEFDAWLRGPLRAEAFEYGIEAMRWTVDERGLGGVSDLDGLPWKMSMEEFFEAWVETLLAALARQIGGVVRTGRQRQTIAPIAWRPPYLGSQKYLLPDVVLERGDTTIIIDAKYKTHWEEMQTRRWRELEEELRERHRADLLQVLAYANLATTSRVTVCLAYPCRDDTWASMRERRQLFHRASMMAGERRIDLRLTALPMGVPMREVVGVLAQEFASEL